MNTEATTSTQFDPAFEVGQIQSWFPDSEKNERGLLLRLRACTQLLTRGVNANLESMDAETLARHKHFIHDLETRWVEFHQQVRSIGLYDKFNEEQRALFENEFGRIRFDAQQAE